MIFPIIGKLLATVYIARKEPLELEWFANIHNAKTRRAYRQDVKDFTAFVGIARPEEFRIVTRAHFISWRKDLFTRNH